MKNRTHLLKSMLYGGMFCENCGALLDENNNSKLAYSTCDHCLSLDCDDVCPTCSQIDQDSEDITRLAARGVLE